MILIFRVNYRTVPGQSLHVCITRLESSGHPLEQRVIPLYWLNSEQWQGQLEVAGDGQVLVEYHYRLVEEQPLVELDEWLSKRSVVADSADARLWLLQDTWSSAGTVDYAYETKAIARFLPGRGPFGEVGLPSFSTHTFLLRMAAVPLGFVPCLIGNPVQIGAWGWHHAVPMREVSANQWQCDVDLPAQQPTEYKYGLYDSALGCVARLETGPNRRLAQHGYDSRQRTIVRDEGFRRDAADLVRAAGVAIPVFSLRSERGFGTGEFADLIALGRWAARVGLKLIQILPINDTTSHGDWRDSYPYSAISTIALHPLYLRLGDLPYEMSAGYHEDLEETRVWLNLLEHVDYEAVMTAKNRFARQVFEVHRESILATRGFKDFVEKNRDWLLPYAVFRFNRERFGTADFSQWPEPWPGCPRELVFQMDEEGNPDFLEISFHLWIQYELDRQLNHVVAELSRLGISLKGDLPIGIDGHSVEAWTSPQWFHLDSQTGAPPDAFAVKGQNWGFPTYNWEAMAADGYSWWKERFSRLSQYFDAYRIDHILGFFRIWSVPSDQRDGIMGCFSPAIPIALEEFAEWGIEFDYERFCRPYLGGGWLWERFGDQTVLALERYLVHVGEDRYALRDHVSTQQKIQEHFESLMSGGEDRAESHRMLRDALMECVSDVLFFEEPGSDGTRFHPRCGMEGTRSYQELDFELRRKISLLSDDYFHRRHDRFWRANALRKLPSLRRATDMLLCGEDLGMVPSCVPGVLAELGILSLEIQRMPKTLGDEFANPAHAPYLSVVSPSTHDMSPLRSWWREDPRVTERFAWQALGNAFPPMDMTPEIALSILSQHLASPAMWAVFPIQDLLATDATLCHSDPDAERINIPSVMPHYWRYRCHLGMEELEAADDFNQALAMLIRRYRR